MRAPPDRIRRGLAAAAGVLSLLLLACLARVPPAADPRALAERLLTAPPDEAPALVEAMAGLDVSSPAGLRDELLRRLNRAPGFDFELSERLEVAWGAAPRRSRDRQVPYAPGAFRFAEDAAAPIAASVYSLSADFFDIPTAAAFLAAVGAAAPGRPLLVLTDLGLTPAPAVELLPTHGRAYTPWPRDPLTLGRDTRGRVLVLVRPNRQRGREEDTFLGRELVQSLSPARDREWGTVGWMESPVPFHNGNLLPAGGALWAALHAFEGRILEILGLDRVPVESFTSAAGAGRYLAAADEAAAELEALHGRPVRWVHPLPRGRGDADGELLMRRIGGGAGYDLDSYLTLLPDARGGLAALVADVAAGRELLAALPPEDWQVARRGYGLAPAPAAIPGLLARYADAPRVRALGDYLDLVAAHLAGEGLRVRRLPLVVVPVALLDDTEGVSHPDFWIGWNNVVVEPAGAGWRAEGFASLLPGADARAAAVFAEFDTRLVLLPPLVHSVVLNGGYRCASNHLRTAGAAETAAGLSRRASAGRE